MRKQFDLQDWLKDKSQKVETRDGRPVKIIYWEAKGPAPIIGLFTTDDGCETTTEAHSDGRWSDDESYESDYDLFLVTPEPEMSEFEESIFKLLRQYKECDIPLTPENIKADASMLWQDFEKYFFYLYGKEGEGDSALRSFYYRGLADGRAEALKDLPRWKKCNPNAIYSTECNLIVNGIGRYIILDGYMIDVDRLKKLPGFKDDE